MCAQRLPITASTMQQQQEPLGHGVQGLVTPVHTGIRDDGTEVSYKVRHGDRVPDSPGTRVSAAHSIGAREPEGSVILEGAAEPSTFSVAASEVDVSVGGGGGCGCGGGSLLDEVAAHRPAAAAEWRPAEWLPEFTCRSVSKPPIDKFKVRSQWYLSKGHTMYKQKVQSNADGYELKQTVLIRSHQRIDHVVSHFRIPRLLVSCGRVLLSASS